ncbi:MAG: ComEC/Rec2 family competence protein [Bacteroidota bacterium]
MRLFIPFAFGIIVQIHFEFSAIWFYYSSAILFFLLLLGAIYKKLYSNFSTNWLFGFFAHIFLFFSGITISDLQKDKLLWTKEINEEGFIVAEIIEQPQEKEKSIKAVLNVTGIKNNNYWIETDGKAIVYFEKDSLASLLETGDQIIFEPVLEDIKTANNPNEFDYKQYLFFHLIAKQAYLKSARWKLLNDKKNSLYVVCNRIRNYLIHLYEQNGMTGDELSIASALTLGYKDKLDADLKRSYSASGAMHVLAVSGLHVGIIYLIFNFLFGFFFKNKRGKIIRSILLLLVLWSYACITGLSPSVLRATIMFSFVIAGSSINRPVNIYNSLAASAFFLLIYDPYIIMEVGFQLSYLAVLSIVIFQPVFYKLLYFKYSVFDKLWALFTVSVAAQIGTAPISIYYFHQFPNYFFISNFIVIPLGTIVLGMGIFVLVFSFIPIISSFFAKILTYIIYALNYSVTEIEKLPGSTFIDISINSGQTIIIYLIIIGLTLLFFTKKAKFVFLILISCISLFTWFVIENYTKIKQREIVVYNINGYTAINFIDGRDNILFSDLDIKENKSQLMFNIKNNWLKLGVENEKILDLKKFNSQFLFSNIITIDNQNLFYKHNYISFYDKRILLINEDFNPAINQEDKKLKIDYILITKNSCVNIEDLIKCYDFKTVIFDSSNSFWQIDKWTKECKDSGINFYNISTSGAFSLNLI